MLPLFDLAPVIRPRVEVAAQGRLTAQCHQILERLQRGPATNRELSAIALKYTSRISDLRQAGYDVRKVSEDRKTGVCVYALGGRA